MLGRIPVLLLVWVSVAGAQPYINYRGVVNAASFAPQGLPNGSIARGSIFTIFGRDLGPQSYVQPASFPLGPVLGGVSITVTQDETTVNAIPVFSWNSQVSAIMPSDAPLGTVIVRVSFNGETSNPAIVNVTASSVGLFALNSGGFGPAVAQNFVTQTEQPINTARVTARRGQTLIAWGTGLGAIGGPDNVAPTPGNFPTDVEIFIGGKVAVRRYAGRSSCCSGLDQFVFDVPPDAPEGCYVPVQIRTAGDVVSNAVTIAIGAAGAPCADTFNPIADTFRLGGRIGLALPQRYESLIEPFNDEPAEITVDKINLSLQDDAGGDTYFNPLVSLPPVGTCTFYGAAAGLTLPDWYSLLAGAGQLDAGSSAQLSGPLGVANVPRRTTPPSLYEALLGKDPPAEGAPPPFLSTPGAFNLKLPGGSQVAAADIGFDMVPPVAWTNRGQSGLIRRSSDYAITWSGGNAARDVVLIAGQAKDNPRNAAGIFLCVAPVDAGGFVVPRYIVSALPPSPAGLVSSPGAIFVGSTNLRDPVEWPIPGLSAAFVAPGMFEGREVSVE